MFFINTNSTINAMGPEDILWFQWAEFFILSYLGKLQRALNQEEEITDIEHFPSFGLPLD